MENREKARLREYQSITAKDTSHLLASPLVPAPIERGRPPKYLSPAPSVTRGPFASSFNSVDMSRSLPDLRGFTSKRSDGRMPFEVSLSTGPLTMGRELKK